MSIEWQQKLEEKLTKDLERNNIKVENDRDGKRVILRGTQPGIKVWGMIDGLINHCGYKIL